MHAEMQSLSGEQATPIINSQNQDSSHTLKDNENAIVAPMIISKFCAFLPVFNLILIVGRLKSCTAAGEIRKLASPGVAMKLM